MTGQLFRYVPLILAFILGVGGLVSAIGVGASAAEQVADRLSAAALNRLFVDDAAIDDVNRAADSIRQLKYVDLVGQRASLDQRFADARWLPESDYAAGRTDVSVEAVDAEYFEMTGMASVPMDSYEWLDTEHRVALISDVVAAESGFGQRRGDKIWIAGTSFEIVGVVSNTTDDATSADVYVPRDVFPQQSGSLVVQTQVGYPAPVAAALPYAIAAGDPGSIIVSTVADLQSLRRGVASDLGLLIAVLGGVLLAVAVFGATVSWLISVQSRTQEIALRRAFGSSTKRIVGAYLVEGLLTGTAGGIAGLAVGTTVVVLFAGVQGWSAVLPAWVIGAAPAIGASSGVAAAALPALRAARINPALAVRP